MGSDYAPSDRAVENGLVALFSGIPPALANEVACSLEQARILKMAMDDLLRPMPKREEMS